MHAYVRDERSLILPVVAAIAAFVLEDSILGMGKAGSLIAAALLVVVIVIVSMRVAQHAEHLAHRVGDPYGTMILTLSAVMVEVIILAILMINESSPSQSPGPSSPSERSPRSPLVESATRPSPTINIESETIVSAKSSAPAG